MMKQKYKRSSKAYFAWNYDKEIEDLNAQSEKGWQLVQGGCFSSKFVKNADVRYRYQIDYPGKVADLGRYLETYREQGWEFINKTFNGWYYFRKPFDPALPAEQYEIFTDRVSLSEMRERWVKLAVGLSVLMGIFAASQLVLYILEPTIPGLIRLLTLGVCLAVFAYGIISMRRPGEGKKARWDGLLLSVFALVMIGGNAVSLLMTESRPFLEASYVSEDTEAIPAGVDGEFVWHTLEIAYRDNYYMDLEIQADAPVCFTILNESGETVYSVQGASVEEADLPLKLDAGVYTIRFSDFSGGSLCVDLDIA